jgi:hypothetical protein
MVPVALAVFEVDVVVPATVVLTGTLEPALSTAKRRSTIAWVVPRPRLLREKRMLKSR